MEQSLIILLRLFAAHIIADFVLQSDRMRDGKKGVIENQKTSKYFYVLLHSSIHAVLSYTFVAQWNNWIIPVVILLTHFAIDCLKSMCKKEGIISFIADQLAHITILILLWIWLFESQIELYNWLNAIITNEYILAIIIAYILVTKPTSIILNLFFSKWNIEDDMKGLPEAGKWIGYLERILVLTFVIISQIEMVGFLLAAKSIFRFGELKRANEIKITEYILIGTFASFTIALILGFIVTKFI